jgi:hypothetical protein
MSLHVHKLATHLRPEEAATLVEFLDQLREVLMQAYGDDIATMLQQASQAQASWKSWDEEEPF